MRIAAAAADIQPAPAGRQRLALVVENDDLAAELLRLQLEDADFRVVRAATAEAALASAAREVPDLMTLDILLPGLDGWEFLERIKQAPLLSAIPVVIVSIVADTQRGISLGAAQVLQKPVTREDMQRALQAIDFPVVTDAVRTVLVVDDDPMTVQLLGVYLGKAGYRVLSAGGSREGIALARGRHPDLIVLDLMMPEVNGFEVVEALKDNPATAAIPVIIVTAKQVAAEDRARLNNDVVKVMEKSDFNHGRFIGEVKRALAGKGKSWHIF